MLAFIGFLVISFVAYKCLSFLTEFLKVPATIIGSLFIGLYFTHKFL